MYAVEINQLWKKYLLAYKKRLSIKDPFLSLWKRKRDFWALQDISINIEKGETVGIIGANGSGKTTLLRTILGITKPTRGKVKVNGRIAGLLELGAGFHQDLTGRENIYLNGSVLGLKKREINKKIGSIIDFAGIEEFIDARLMTYSEGMSLRLGFAIAVHIDPEILVIDEILGVGDKKFLEKSFQRILKFKREKRTIVIVSHDLPAVSMLATKAILLKDGKIYNRGDPGEVIDCYQELLRYSGNENYG